MADEFLNTDISWDDPESLFDETEPEGSSNCHFGHIQLYVVQVTKAKNKEGQLVGGHFFTLPNVTGSDFKDKDENGLMMFKTYDIGGKEKLYVFVATKENKDGEEYQIVKSYPDRKYTRDDSEDSSQFSIGKNMAIPAVIELDKSTRSKLQKGMYAKWDELPTGFEFDGNDITYWANFKVFASKEEMNKASEEFFSQFSGGDSNSTFPDYYPRTWDTEEFDWLNYAKEQAAEISDLKELAVSIMLVDDGEGNFVQSQKFEDGKVATAINGELIPIKKVLAEIKGIPEQMVKL